MEFSTNPSLLVGKPVRDEYGRQIGRVTSFMVSLDGCINEILVEHGDGEFFRYPSNQFVRYGDGVTLLSPTKQRAKTLCHEMPLVRRKNEALSGLLQRRKISSEMFNSLHNIFENALDELEADAQTTLEYLDKQSIRCTQRSIDIRLAMLHLEVEHEIGEIDGKSYQTAIEMLQDGSRRTEAEIGDLEAIRNELSHMLLDKITQTEKEKKPPPAALMLPEPPT